MTKLFIIFAFVSNSIFAQRDNSSLSFLKTEEEAAMQRLNLLEKAKYEILVSYFIYDDDRIGLSGLVLLLDRVIKNPNLKVKLLLDASANKIDKAILYELENYGLEIKEFHPLPKIFVPSEEFSPKDFARALKRVNRRMHDKLLIVDGKELVIGGRNVGSSYYDLDEKNFHDRDIYLRSIEAVKDSRRCFLKMWNSDHVGSIVYRKKDITIERRKEALSRILEQIKIFRTTEDLNVHKRGDFSPSSYGLHHKSIKFLSSYNPMTRKFDPNYLSENLIKIAVVANKRVTIETPYLLPTERFFILARYLQKRNIELNVITNSYCSTDVTAISGAYDIKKKRLLEYGVKIYEYKGSKYLHAKSATIDDDISIVGTYNLDPRSAQVNTEVAVVIKDQSVTKALNEQLQEDMRHSSLVQIRNGKIQGSYDECDKSLKDKFIYYLMRPISRVPWIYNLL